MRLTCPTCSRAYSVGRADLGDAGRMVICSECQTQWFAGAMAVPPAASNDDRQGLVSKATKTPRQLAAGPSFLERAILPWTARAAVAATLVIALTASITQRDRIVRHAPRTAVLYKRIGLEVNPIGLAFNALVPRRLDSSDLMVAGGIRNVVHRRVAVPRIAFEVRDAAGTVLLSWSEAAPARSLDPGATMSFASAPHRLPAESASVIVRFASDDRDAAPPVGKVASVD